MEYYCIGQQGLHHLVMTHVIYIVYFKDFGKFFKGNFLSML